MARCGCDEERFENKSTLRITGQPLVLMHEVEEGGPCRVAQMKRLTFARAPVSQP